MSGKILTKFAAIAGVLALLAAAATTQRVPVVHADPCGMVPPILAGKAPEIERTGLKKTYVFYKNGIETFAIRPGFAGKLSEFGMLVPVPGTPSIKKIPDNIFAQIEMAIDPPEIPVWVNPIPPAAPTATGFGGGRLNRAEKEGNLRFEDKVTVVKQEAVGMYTVVVLDAGSVKALKQWINENNYRFPDGMEQTCEEYIVQGWQFVAVKAKLGSKPAIEPRPGLSDPKVELPEEARFEGYGQGMAFRFRSDHLVVPMRLSAYNAGDTHNVVYLLTDEPKEIRDIPREFVVRQLSGEELYLNVTQPLPLRIMDGTPDQLTPEILSRVAPQRDPTPHNGLARELFCADLLAARMGDVDLEFEEREKDLLNISEELGLRGEEIDGLHRQAAKLDRGRDYDAALFDLVDMTLTVVDGMFPRETLRRDNLNFAAYNMPAERNRADVYHVPSHAKPRDNRGVRWVDQEQRYNALDVARLLKSKPLPGRKVALAEAESRGENIFVPPPVALAPAAAAAATLPWWTWLIVGVGALSLAALAFVVGKRVGGRPVASALLAAAGLFALSGATTDGVCASAAKPDAKPKFDPEISRLVGELGDRKTVEKALESLIKHHEQAVPALFAEAYGGASFATRGWSIVALSRIGGADVESKLASLHDDSSKHVLVRTWAAAARISLNQDGRSLKKMLPLVAQLPALGKPLAKKLAKLSGADGVEAMLVLATQHPELQASLQDAIAKQGADEMASVMFTARSQEVRRMAASYLGGMGDAARATIDALAFSKDAAIAPWDGGALFIPGIRWTKEDGEKLVTNLMKWGVWCERADKSVEIQQITNNLNSVGLARVVGFQMTWDAKMTSWLKSWGDARGKAAVQQILAEVGAGDDPKYTAVLDKLK